MPQAIPFIIAAAVKVGISSILIGALVSVAINFAISFVLKKLFPVKKPKFGASFTAEAQERTLVLRSSVTPHRIVYGKSMLSGPLIYANVAGGKKLLYLLIGLVGSEIESIYKVLFNDKDQRASQFAKTRQQIMKLTIVTPVLVSGDQYKAGVTINGDNFEVTRTWPEQPGLVPRCR